MTIKCEECIYHITSDGLGALRLTGFCLPKPPIFPAINIYIKHQRLAILWIDADTGSPTVLFDVKIPSIMETLISCYADGIPVFVDVQNNYEPVRLFGRVFKEILPEEGGGEIAEGDLIAVSEAYAEATKKYNYIKNKISWHHYIIGDCRREHNDKLRKQRFEIDCRKRSAFKKIFGIYPRELQLEKARIDARDEEIRVARDFIRENRRLLEDRLDLETAAPEANRLLIIKRQEPFTTTFERSYWNEMANKFNPTEIGLSIKSNGGIKLIEDVTRVSRLPEGVNVIANATWIIIVATLMVSGANGKEIIMQKIKLRNAMHRYWIIIYKRWVDNKLLPSIPPFPSEFKGALSYAEVWKVAGPALEGKAPPRVPPPKP